MKIILLLILSLLLAPALAQNSSTAETTLEQDTISTQTLATIGGYGNAVYTLDLNEKNATINLERFVLFIGKKFSKQISFFSELEVEDAKVTGGKTGGELALEQAYLKFNMNPSTYLVAGLIIPRIGILNENHLPTSFNGNKRTQVQTNIIPTTWRELGIGLYGNLRRFPVSYSIALVNGLNAAGFKHGSVIRGGRYKGSIASGNNFALTGSLQYFKNNFKIQVSGYHGGSNALPTSVADTLKLSSGFFGTPVSLGEANIQYENKGFSIIVLGAIVSLSDASKINQAFHNNTPKTAYGILAELGYNVLETMKKYRSQKLNVFVQFERLDMNRKIPTDGIMDGTLNQQHITTGLSYLPIKNVVVKIDFRAKHTGKPNAALINPPALVTNYNVNSSFLNLGIGYSF